MTLSTNIYVLDEVDAREVFRFCQGLLTQYDEDGGHRGPDQQEWEDRQDKSWSAGESFVEPGNPSTIANAPMQNLPAWLMLHYRPGAPLATSEQAEACNDDCEPDEGYHYHPHACWLDIDFDTAYGYKDERGWSCGDLHAALVSELGQWLDAKGVRWEWRNEYTGEVHGGEDRYRRLVDLGVGGFEASAWYRTTALPAILSHIASEQDES